MAGLNKVDNLRQKNGSFLFNYSSKEKITADIFKKKSINP